jgi:adenosylcobinamide-GDP ribazoletransferase
MYERFYYFIERPLPMRSFIFALAHLTRLPLPAVSFDEEAFGRSTALYPLAGLVLGGILAAFWLLTAPFLPAPLMAALLVVGMVVLTGGIHLDGFMDSIDGLFSGRSRGRKLEIMRDSRVGAFGVLGLVCLLLIKYNLYLCLTRESLPLLLLVVPALSRWCIILAIAHFPYAREEGLGKLHGAYTGKREVAIATLTAAAASGAALGAAGGCLLVVGGALTFFTGIRVTRALGGLTGDIYGFINEVMEVCLLFAAYLLLTWVPPGQIWNWRIF